MSQDWYRDAVFYEVFVRAFADSNGDGIGDLAGLATKLDYLQGLGVEAIWMLPICPSPLRDDGYDVADYFSIHPDYGTLDDFRALVAEAHARGLRLIVELVPNHTSDQCSWFQASRDPSHPDHATYRDWYVWSDSDQRYKDARVIFLDSLASNWTYDPLRCAYYWHRFFAHQPDLNYDHPEVQRAMLRVAQFWLDLGVDGLRVDATPYLYEREGTSCENLPETHDYLKRLRKFVDAYAPGAMLLSEANQWPEAVRDYFGDGDEFHMNFHFPLMPRIFMALAKQDSSPILEIMARTPALPEGCQWATFLRCHDELTLEMVTAEEREFMWDYYAPEPRMRLNLGIRRRLAPLLHNDPELIELANSLLFSLPGSPVIYYGDEIGMGDNIWLEDRDGVRTPMQWSANRGAGFSSTPLDRFADPVIDDETYGYRTVNVAAQQTDPGSVFSRTRRLIRVRGQHPVLARGTHRFIAVEDRAVLACVRESPDETVLVVSNLSAEPLTLETALASIVGDGVSAATIVDLFTGTVVDEIGAKPLHLRLEGHGYRWLGVETHA